MEKTITRPSFILNMMGVARKGNIVGGPWNPITQRFHTWHKFPNLQAAYEWSLDMPRFDDCVPRFIDGAGRILKLWDDDQEID